MESTLRRRLLIAASAGLACLLPVACDAAAASPQPSAYHRPSDGAKPTGKNRPGHNHGATRTTTAGATATGDPSVTATTAPDGAGGAGNGAGGADGGAGAGGADGGAGAGGADGGAGAGAGGGVGTVGPGGKDGKNNGQQVLARDCSGSQLGIHDGFQLAPKCVQTQMGEVAAEDKDPSLLITDAPTTVAAGTPFEISVSTRNLVRDRFLGAAAGGYYLEASVLNADGIQRGHFHTACRILGSTSEAPDAAPVPAFFKATEDGKGGTTPDTVQVALPSGLPSAGLFQCAVWAGDGSHRTPMMQRANQTPAFDVVRIKVT